MVKTWHISIIMEKFCWTVLDYYYRDYTDIAQVKNLNTYWYWYLLVLTVKCLKRMPASERFQEVNEIIYVKMLTVVSKHLFFRNEKDESSQNTSLQIRPNLHLCKSWNSHINKIEVASTHALKKYKFQVNAPILLKGRALCY